MPSLLLHPFRQLTACLPIVTAIALLTACGDSDRSRVLPLDVPDPQLVLLGPEAPGNTFIASTMLNLSLLGYQESEFFVSGTARSFVSQGALEGDGRWAIETADEADYKTRIVVYRPINSEDFNGTVIIEWLNVSGNVDAAPDWTMMHNELIREGYAWVGVSAQSVGIEGGSDIGLVGIELPLKAVNAARYGTLNHPGDSFSYDMFTQVAQAVRKPMDVDPLDGLHIERMIAAGESQSATRLLSYVNMIAPRIDLFDAYFIHSRLGSSAPLSQSPQADIPAPDVVTVRTDLEKPVMMFQTESDVLLAVAEFLPSSAYASRQDDSDYFRLWEVAGTAHADVYTIEGMQDAGNDYRFALLKETNSTGIGTCDQPINAGPQHFYAMAAMHALEKWVRTGEAPANAERLSVAEDTLSYQRDEHNNVLGGIRSPYLDAPIASFTGVNDGVALCILFGTTHFLDSAVIAGLYPNHADYVQAVSEAADQSVADGFLLAADAALIKEAAENTDLDNL